MITPPESSPSRITSSPSLSPQSHPSPQTHDAAEPVTMPHNSPLLRVQSLRSDEGSLSLNELTVLCTSLSTKVQSLETELKETKQTYNSTLIKLIRRMKKLEQIMKASKSRRRARVVLSDDEEGRTSVDTEILLEQEEPTELVEDLGSGKKGEKEISTADVPGSTASEIPEVSTAIPER
ncbi:hypothetical protein Tco_1086357 [Tanacetum coccineum]